MGCPSTCPQHIRTPFVTCKVGSKKAQLSLGEWAKNYECMRATNPFFKEQKSCSVLQTNGNLPAKEGTNWTDHLSRPVLQAGLQAMMSTAHPHLRYQSSANSSFSIDTTLLAVLPKCPAPGNILPNTLPLVFMEKKPYIHHGGGRGEDLKMLTLKS